MSGTLEIISRPPRNRWCNAEDSSPRRGSPPNLPESSAATAEPPGDVLPQRKATAAADRALDWIEDSVSRILELTQLSEGWDSYDGRPPSIALAVSFINLLVDIAVERPKMPAPNVLATPDAGIEIHWSNQQGTLSIAANDAGNCMVKFIEGKSRHVTRERFDWNSLAKILPSVDHLLS